MARGPGDVVRGEDVVELARGMGFPLVGVVRALPIDRDDEGRLRDWIGAGKHGEMGWLADTVEERVDPRRAMAGAKSMIVVGEQYWRRNADGAFPEDADGEAYLRKGVGRVARYARGADYHRRLKKRLFALNDALLERYRERLATAEDPSGRAGVKAVVDTAPVMERQHAARAGIGWTGKHTLVIHPRRGSYLFLGAVLTTLEISEPKNQRETPDRCGTCTRCIDACPTDAITAYEVDATRCVSYLTIEHRGLIDEGLHAGMGEWLFGCDVCQEVCPHNSARTGRAGLVSARGEYAPFAEGAGRVAGGAGFDLLEVLGWTEGDRRAAFERSAMKRAGLAMMRRNGLIAAGNAVVAMGDVAARAALMDRVREIAGDAGEDALVRETARVVLRRIEGTGGA